MWLSAEVFCENWWLFLSAVAGYRRHTRRHGWHLGSHRKKIRSNVYMGLAAKWQSGLECTFPTTLQIWQNLLPACRSTESCLFWTDWTWTSLSVQWLPAISQRSLGHCCPFRQKRLVVGVDRPNFIFVYFSLLVHICFLQPRTTLFLFSTKSDKAFSKKIMCGDTQELNEWSNELTCIFRSVHY